MIQLLEKTKQTTDVNRITWKKRNKQHSWYNYLETTKQTTYVNIFTWNNETNDNTFTWTKR